MHVVNFWDRANLVYRYGHIVRDTVKRNRVAINRQEGRARVIVTRLSNRTGSQNCLSFGFQFVTLSNDWLNEFPFRWVVPFEHALDVGMAADADCVKLFRDSVQLFWIVDVFRKDPFAHVIGRPMREVASVFDERSTKRRENIE